MAVLKSNNLCHVNQISPSVFSSIVLVLFSSVHRALVVEPWSSTDFLTQCGFFFFKSEISDMTTAKSSTAFHDSTRLPSKTSGHCFETNAEFQLENVDTTTSSTMVRNDVNTRNLPFHIRSYRPRHLESPCNTSKVRTRSTTHHSLLGKSKKGYYLRNRNMGECSCCNSSQDD